MRRQTVVVILLFVALAVFAVFASQAEQAKAGPNPIWGTPSPVSTSAIAFAGSPQMEQDGLGVQHLIFDFCSGGCGLFYTQRVPGGNWSPLETPPGLTPGRYSETLLVSSDGTSHVFWSDYMPGSATTGFHYVRRDPSGIWSEPEERSFFGNRLVGHERNGSVYIVGDTLNVRAPDGTWTAEPVPGFVYSFAIAPSGEQFLLYRDGVYDLVLTSRLVGDPWATGELVASTPSGLDTAKLVLDNAGNPRITWRDNTTFDCFPFTCNGYRLHYREANSGTWSAQEDLALLKGNNYPFVTSDVAVADDGTPYVMWSSDEELKDQPTVYVSRRNGVNNWTTPSVYSGFGVRLLAHQGTIHAFWQYQARFLYHWIAYSTEGYWSYPASVAYSDDVSMSFDVDPDIDGSDRLHLFWGDRSQTNTFRLMYQSWDAANAPTQVPTPTATVPVPTATPIPLNQRVYLPGLSK